MPSWPAAESRLTMYHTILLSLALAALTASAAAQAVMHFKRWTAVCDNLRTCSALGYTDEGATMTPLSG